MKVVNNGGLLQTARYKVGLDVAILPIRQLEFSVTCTRSTRPATFAFSTNYLRRCCCKPTTYYNKSRE